jgi:heme/copper-type cytochrome/quinol oxidase subunit 2
MGVAALVLGIIAVVLFMTHVFAIVLGVLAVIFGGVGRGKASRGEATNGGQALAGLILGAVGIVAGAVVLVLFVVSVSRLEDIPPDDLSDTSTVVTAVRSPAHR